MQKQATLLAQWKDVGLLLKSATTHIDWRPSGSAFDIVME